MAINDILLFCIVGLPLVLAPLVAVLGRVVGSRAGWLAFAAPVISCASLVTLALRLPPSTATVLHYEWVGSLGIHLSFLIDGLSVMFGLIVSGMGVLVFFYARKYLEPDMPHSGRFYAYLTFFMAAMLGTVLSNNLLLLFIFWEMTGIASFLLIGFNHHDEAARVGARQALLVTGITGLCLLVGVIMIFVANGTYDFATIKAAGLDTTKGVGWIQCAMFFVVLGAFGKSAQFPVHFWLPNAMSAPTPVSAYLHSATMVKLGVFLCARMFPLFVEVEGWAIMLGVVGFTTMLVCACMAVFSHDLKAILAYSTVSQLGFLVGYYGLGQVGGVPYDQLHILSHVLYKGCLFMVVGIVVHSTHAKDIRELGGLLRAMPVLAGVTLIAAASMAGLPGTLGFIAKEMMLKELFLFWDTHGALGGYAAVCMIVASIAKVAFSARLFGHIFLGPTKPELAHHFHAPGLGVQLSPLLLAGLALITGLLPGLLDAPLSALAVTGLHKGGLHLALWHGPTKELAISMGIIAAGFGVYAALGRTRWAKLSIPGPLRFDRFFERGLDAFARGAKWITYESKADRPPMYLFIIVCFTVVVMAGTLLPHVVQPSAGGLPYWAQGLFSNWRPLPGFVTMMIACCSIAVVVLERPTSQLISLSVVGFLICFYYVLYQAPDLALTQILVEVVTLFLVLILLGRFSARAQRGEQMYQLSFRRKFGLFMVALAVGCTMSLLVLLVNLAPPETALAATRLGEDYLRLTVPLAEGSNAVNTILVDFRGFDTLGEITVLLVATLGGLGLMMRYRRTESEYAAAEMGPPGFGESSDEDPTLGLRPPPGRNP